MHVGLDHYFLTLRRVLPRELLLQQAHRHLMHVCSTCRREWGGREGFASPTAGGEVAWTTADLLDRQPPAERDFSLTLYDSELARQKRMRAIARRAREDVAQLRNQPVSDWPAIVRKAKTRFRSRAFALLVIEESRALVDTAPRQAAALAALVPLALERSPERKATPWVRVLTSRAEAYRGNALRVAGDLPAADRAFATLRTRLAESPLADPEAEAEIASLEASPCEHRHSCSF